MSAPNCPSMNWQKRTLKVTAYHISISRKYNLQISRWRPGHVEIFNKMAILSWVRRVIYQFLRLACFLHRVIVCTFYLLFQVLDWKPDQFGFLLLLKPQNDHALMPIFAPIQFLQLVEFLKDNSFPCSSMHSAFRLRYKVPRG